MYIRERNKRFTVVIRKKGFHAQYKTFNKKSDAQRYGRSIEAEMELKQFKSIARAANTSLLDVLKKHLLERQQKSKDPNKEVSRFKSISKHPIVNKSLADLAPMDFAEYRNHRIEKGISGSTVNRELSFMSVAINFAIDVHKLWIPENPIKRTIKPKEPPPRNRRLNNDEYQRLLNWSKGDPRYNKPNPFWSYAIRFAIETALRRNEQLSITWNDIDFEKRLLTIKAEHTKTGTERFVPLSSNALNILKLMPRSILGNGRVFPMSKNNFNRGWNNICRNACIENLRWHDLRREACSRLLEKGLSISEVQMFTGHKTVSLMLKTYTSHSPINVANKLNKEKAI